MPELVYECTGNTVVHTYASLYTMGFVVCVCVGGVCVVLVVYEKVGGRYEEVTQRSLHDPHTTHL